MTGSSPEAATTPERCSPYFAHDPERLAEIRSLVEEPLFHEFGFQLNDQPSRPNQLEFCLPYGRHTQMAGPVLWVTLGIVNDDWHHARKIEMHIFGMGKAVELGFRHFDSPEEILSVVRMQLQMEGLAAKIRQGVTNI